jgi:hypothetical protein
MGKENVRQVVGLVSLLVAIFRESDRAINYPYRLE